MVTIDRLDGYRPRTYRRASKVSYLVGIAALLVGIFTENALLGIGVYLAAFVVGVSIQYFAPKTVCDERDRELSARAGEIVLRVTGIGGFVVFVSLMVLQELGRYTWSSELWSVFFAWSSFWLLYGATYTYVRFRERV